MNTEKINQFLSTSHEKISGWFFPLDQIIFFELFAAQQAMKLRGDICEVGVYQGKSLVMLSLLKDQEEQLYGFDLFDDDDEDITKANLNEYGDNSKVFLLKGSTSNLTHEKLGGILKSSIRFLHIDAGHEYHEVLEQLY